MCKGIFKNNSDSRCKKTGKANITANLRLQYQLGQATEQQTNQKFNSETQAIRKPMGTLLRIYFFLLYAGKTVNTQERNEWALESSSLDECEPGKYKKQKPGQSRIMPRF